MKSGNRKSLVGVAKRAKAQDAAHRTSDSFTNFIARLGYGQNNQLSASYYNFDYLTKNRTQLEAMYRTAWLIGQAVDCPAEDMTRAGIEIIGSLKPEQVEDIQASILDLQLWAQLCNGVRWARLFGGAIGVILIDGQDVSTPLRVDTIGKGQFKGLLVLDRWMVQPSLGNLITELGPELGRPKFYEVIADAMALPHMKIHHTRVIRFEGMELPYYQKLVENGWGQSVVERIHDRIIAFDSTTMGAAQLVYKAHLRTIKIQGLRDLVSQGGKLFEGLMKQIDTMRMTQSNEGITLLDGEDEFETQSYTFSGLSDILLQFAQQIAGALQIPLVRLLGQSPAGLNSTGEGDLRTYYDNIAKKQETDLRIPLRKLLDITMRSLGIAPPKDFAFKFRPLWQVTETEKADIASKDASAVGDAYDRGIISQATALRELRQSSYVSGRFSNITDEDIEAADTVPSANQVLAGGETEENEQGSQLNDEVAAD